MGSGAEPDTLRWRAHPLVDDFPRSALLLVIVGAVCAGAGVAFGGLGYALLAAGFLAVSLARYFVPTHYELGASGATVRFLGQTRTVRWEAVKRVDVHRDGVHLSPFEHPSRLDSFRGTFLRFSGNADEAVSFVQHRVATAE